MTTRSERKYDSRARAALWLIGVGLVAGGCAWLSPPAGVIAAGALVVIDCYMR